MGDQPRDASEKDEIVITPGGPRSRNLVHPVRPGEAVYVDDEGNAKVVPHEDRSPAKERPKEEKTCPTKSS